MLRFASPNRVIWGELMLGKHRQTEIIGRNVRIPYLKNIIRELRAFSLASNLRWVATQCTDELETFDSMVGSPRKPASIKTREKNFSRAACLFLIKILIHVCDDVFVVRRMMDWCGLFVNRNTV